MDIFPNYRAYQAQLPGNTHTLLNEERKAALERVQKEGLFFAENESTQYLPSNAFPLPERLKEPEPSPKEEDIAGLSPSDDEFLFLDGQRVQTRGGPLETPALMTDWLSALENGSLQVQDLPRIPARNGLSDLVIALAGTGVLIELPEGVILEKPIHIRHLNSGNTPLKALRHFIRIGKGASATIIEHHSGPDGVQHLALSTTTIHLDEGAHLNHYKFQQEGSACHHFGGIYIVQHPRSKLHQFQLALGGRISRTDIQTVLEDGAHCDLDGVFLTKDRALIDTHTQIRHAGVGASSRDRYRGIASDQSRGIFQGRIIVDPGARGTRAEMQSRNLLLSENAEIDVKPQLEIHNDDVQCSHGVTLGTLDDEQVFYLASRGVGQKEARKILTFGFTNEVLDALRPESLRQYAQALLESEITRTISPENPS